MTQPSILRIGGVPEHFNLPWHQAIAQNRFKEAGVALSWQDYPGGTGAMMQALRDDELDIAVALTEGVVAEIISRQSCRILQLYVQTPLVWGIHVPAASAWQEMRELEDKRYAISRMGSGSHLMAFVNARQQGWNPEKMSLVTVGNLEGARQAFGSGAADVFMWEKFMTKPLVDSGEFRRVGECPTPWPCFVIAGSERVLQQKAAAIEKMLSVIKQACRDFMQDKAAPQQVAERYQLQPEDAQRWFEQTTWATDNSISAGMLQQVMDTLHALGSISIKPDPKLLCADFCLLE